MDRSYRQHISMLPIFPGKKEPHESIMLHSRSEPGARQQSPGIGSQQIVLRNHVGDHRNCLEISRSVEDWGSASFGLPQGTLNMFPHASFLCHVKIRTQILNDSELFMVLKSINRADHFELSSYQAWAAHPVYQRILLKI